jgi:hypothetical protein
MWCLPCGSRRAKLKGSVPPTFLYLMCLMVWVACACLVWLAAGLMFLATRTRALAKQMCFAMAGTFPFVFTISLLPPPLSQFYSSLHGHFGEF